MTPAQLKKYNELKKYYRVKLAKKIETQGIGRAKIQVLEALLRLRQVACDPRLLDPKAKPGAKLELLGQQIGDVVSEGHKVLVFSQFTSLLALVKQQFDEAKIQYEYLDGSTRDRKSCVQRFQDDKNVAAFLISLKAGGHGLNLTAADYVYLLDPWWNPAVEAQAIDRAHRMGQQRPVIAYRMILPRHGRGKNCSPAENQTGLGRQYHPRRRIVDPKYDSRRHTAIADVDYRLNEPFIGVTRYRN